MRKDLNGSEVLIVFNLTELWRSFSKGITNTIIPMNVQAADGEFLAFIWKVFKKILRALCFERKMKSEIKLHSEHLF